MELNIEAQLNNTRNLLKELGNSVSSLVNASPDVFNDPQIKSCLEEFLTVYEEAVQRLENPSFRIATLGTTSSGKSTIVNALIGRKIAPIEAGEMSGGVLTIKHSQEQKLIIAETEDAAWETGEWTGLSDEDLYQRISTVMHSYHAARKKRDYVAPQITAHVPLLPACDAALLGLPNGIGVELIDLPGLKSVQDRANLATIQTQVNKAFNLVALDYMQVDDDHRKRLLEELKTVVEYLQGSTDSMIFILNRVDNRGADDLPLSERIDQLREGIKEVLSLKELPDVLRFNARLLYYAQCAWGSNSPYEPSIVDPKTRLERLKALFRDCASTIEEYTDQNEELEKWFYEVKREVKRGQPINDETMRKILRYSLEWSGGRELWDCFHRRVQESFAKMVILPALLEVFANYDALAKSLDVLIEARKIYNQQQVTQEREKIAKIRQDFHKDIKNIKKTFDNKLKKLVEGLKKKNNSMTPIEFINENPEITGFARVFHAVAEVEGDLTKYLIVPVRDALKNNQGAFKLRDKLGEVISPALADDIAKAYDDVSRRLSKFSSESEHLVKRVRDDDNKGKKELEHDERYVRLLYHTMRQAISVRAEFLLQGKAKQFEDALESLGNAEIEELKKSLSEANLSSIKLEKAAISNLLKKLAQNPPTLPDEFFELPDAIKQNRSKQTEVVGTKTEYETRTKTEEEEYTESYQDGSCFASTKTRTKTRPVTRNYEEAVTSNVYEDIEYVELFLPSPDLMAKQWLSGIEKGKGSLWDILQKWIQPRLDYVSTSFEESVDEVTNLAERALQQQLRIIEDNFEQEKQFWRDFEVQKNNTTELCQKLEEGSRQ
ncbi:dynamin family protein [Microcoleus sp. FACHB-672]|uniref:dynamin family protein n=1 Tax=Microcoleus sp. FACHB-672 TaxID=2692825 RepID=UPI001687411D|nr:dynamin family protein [Microcoleus sp. FACHB-672]MBD2043603.1 dynamin family protein [Microcoleus sp. FACHB-672]